jgi:hypothetical protein
MAALYPTAEQARITVAIVQATRVVRDLNSRYLRAGKGAPVTARFGKDGITIVDPCRLARGKLARQTIYQKPL